MDQKIFKLGFADVLAALPYNDCMELRMVDIGIAPSDISCEAW